MSLSKTISKLEDILKLEHSRLIDSFQTELKLNKLKICHQAAKELDKVLISTEEFEDLQARALYKKEKMTNEVKEEIDTNLEKMRTELQTTLKLANLEHQCEIMKLKEELKTKDNELHLLRHFHNLPQPQVEQPQVVQPQVVQPQVVQPQVVQPQVVQPQVVQPVEKKVSFAETEMEEDPYQL